MSNNQKKESKEDIHVKQVKPRTKLNDLEKTVILNFKSENKDKDKEVKDDSQKPKKKSLYDTVILKLDDLINKNNSLNKKSIKKVTKVEPRNKKKKSKKKLFNFNKNKKINVDSEEFGKQLYKLNKIALHNLTNQESNTKIRKYTSLNKLEKIDKVHVSRKNYEKYHKQLNKFAINKLYYKIAPKETKKYKVYKTCIIISSLVFIFSSIAIINWFIQGMTVSKLKKDLVDTTPIELVDDGSLYNVDESNDTKVKESLYWKYLNTPLSSVDFTELLKENKDTIGWIILNQTNVNYPVVQTKDNDYYLEHAFDKTPNKAGWIYADFRDDFNNFNNNLVIYGHGRKDKVMFGSLVNTLNKSWYKNTNNQIIQLSTIKYNTMWQIFSIYKIEAESYYITTDFASDEEYADYLDTMKQRSIYDFGISVTPKDKILTLSTCYNDNGIRLVIQAKLVKMQQR